MSVGDGAGLAVNPSTWSPLGNYNEITITLEISQLCGGEVKALDAHREHALSNGHTSGTSLTHPKVTHIPHKLKIIYHSKKASGGGSCREPFMPKEGLWQHLKCLSWIFLASHFDSWWLKRSGSASAVWQTIRHFGSGRLAKAERRSKINPLVS